MVLHLTWNILSSEFSSHVLITEGSDYRDSKIIFEADKLSLAIKWMWRELLVISASKKLPLRPIMKEINGYHLLNEVLGYLRTPNGKDYSYIGGELTSLISIDI